MPTKIPRIDPPPGNSPRSSFRETPLQHVRFIYINFTQGLFYQRPEGSMHWDPDLMRTEIVITAESPISTETLNDRPGITFTRAPVGFFHLGFDDMDNYDVRTGKKTKALLVPGTMVINVSSRSDIESENIAWWLAQQLWLQRDMLMQQGFYDVGRQLKVGAPSPPGAVITGDGANEWFCTTITSPFHFPVLGAVTPLNKPVVNEMEMNFRLASQVPLQQGVPVPGANGSVDYPYQTDVFPQPPFAGGAQDPNLRTVTNPSGLPLVPHPLNPSKLVFIRPARADQPGTRMPANPGPSLPIPQPNVEESESTPSVADTIKV